MEKRVSATEARIHFGELIRKVKEENRAYVVERSGEPYVVVVSLEEYERLKKGGKPNWREALERALKLGAEINARRGDESLPDPTDVLHEMREERAHQLLEACGWPLGDEERG
jgi:prevent-host-death family protein